MLDIYAVSYLDQHSQDDEILAEEESHGSSETPPCWPSHARRQRKKHDGIFCFEQFLF